MSLTRVITVMGWLPFSRTISDATETLNNRLAEVGLHGTRSTTQSTQSYGGAELDMNESFDALYKTRGIIQEMTAPRSLERSTAT